MLQYLTRDCTPNHEAKTYARARVESRQDAGAHNTNGPRRIDPQLIGFQTVVGNVFFTMSEATKRSLLPKRNFMTHYHRAPKRVRNERHTRVMLELVGIEETQTHSPPASISPLNEKSDPCGPSHPMPESIHHASRWFYASAVSICLLIDGLKRTTRPIPLPTVACLRIPPPPRIRPTVPTA